MTAPDHNKIIGILFLIFGGGNFVLLAAAGFQMWTAVRDFETQSAANGVPTSLRVVLIALGATVLVSALVQAAAGFGMLKRKSWAQAAALCAAIFALVLLPVGTALGAYALWFLSSNAGKRFFAANRTARPQIS